MSVCELMHIIHIHLVHVHGLSERTVSTTFEQKLQNLFRLVFRKSLWSIGITVSEVTVDQMSIGSHTAFHTSIMNHHIQTPFVVKDVHY